jgi:hypothetical protein
MQIPSSLHASEAVSVNSPRPSSAEFKAIFKVLGSAGIPRPQPEGSKSRRN